MEPKRTLHSGNLVRGVHAGDRKLFMEKYYDPQRYMELGTCFVREDGKIFILLKDRWWMGGRKMNQKTQQEGYRNFNLKSLTEEEERFIKKLVDAEVASKPESFQILKIEDKEENFSFMETMGKENHNIIKNSAGL